MPSFVRRKHLLLAAAAAGALVWLAFAGWAGWTGHSGAPAADTFMTRHYGRYVPAQQAWVKDGDDAAKPERVYGVCASKDIRLNGEAHRLLAVCGRTPKETSFSEPGTVDLYVLKRAGADWAVAAQRSNIESGRMGQAGEVSVIQLGASFHGFELGDTWVSQGYVLGGTRLYVPSGDSIHPALEFTSSVNNSGTRECADTTPSECSDLSRRLKTEAQGDTSLYTLRITSAGTYRGKPVAGSHVLTYDARRHQYRLPAGFEAQIE
jgi:hypothetical protein